VRLMWQTRPVRSPLARLPEGRVRILIAGRDPSFSRSLRASLDAYDAIDVVGIAGDGSEAIELVERLKPSVVLMDVAMSDVDGIEATRRMRKLADSPSVLLIASDTEEIADRAAGAGAAGYLRKGSDIGALLDVVLAFAHAQARPS
jgi:DNA-binding NarL/FixJ family response regulator